MARRSTSIGFVCSALMAGATLIAGAQDDEGRLTYNTNCRTCHSLTEGDNRLGPSLHNIVGAEAAASDGYANYSQALRQSGIVWDEETLDAFIAEPDKVVPGNNMKPYAGIPDAEVRERIVSYLKSQSEG